MKILQGLRGDNKPSAVKILITGKLHEVALSTLRNPPKDLEVGVPLNIVYKPDCDKETLLKEVADAHVLVSRSETDVNEEVLKSGKALSLVARAAVGFGNIDVDLATELGVLVVNTPGKNTNSAAELTLGLLLALVRKIPSAHETVRQGGWDRHRFTGTELGEKTIGIVGLGNVGHRVAKFARGFDMKAIAYDPYISDEVFRRNGCERKNTLESLLAECDVLTVHTPLNEETKGMIGEVELRKLKKGSLVINAARGGIVAEDALLKVLDEGYLAGAGIDTWSNEPKPLAALSSHEKVIVTPHIGASTHEAQYRIGETIAVQILKALRGEIVDYPVNLPHVSVLGTGAARQYAVLAEKIARVATQLLDFAPVRIRLGVQAQLNKDDLKLLRLSAIKGFLSNTADEFVSYVNAERLLEKRGIVLEEELSNIEAFKLKNGLVIEVEGSQAHERTIVGAVLYDEQHVRLSLINGFLFEIEPEGEILVLQNHDRPGVIGDVGNFLSKNNINIAQFELSRNRRGGMAMSLVRVDGGLEASMIAELLRLPNMIFARRITGL